MEAAGVVCASSSVHDVDVSGTGEGATTTLVFEAVGGTTTC